jgi:hypothetical protein
MSSNYFASTMKITGEKHTNKKGKKILPLSEIQRMKNLVFNENANNQNIGLSIQGKSCLNSKSSKQKLKGKFFDIKIVE